MRDLSTFALVGERYLDNQHDPAHLQALETELALRRVVGLRRAAYEYVAASALWWNVVWWEWIRLDHRDIRIGWLQNLALFLGVAIAVWHFSGGMAALVSVAVLHGLTLLIGLRLRSGSFASTASSNDNPT